MHDDLLIACHECDLLHRIGPVPEGDSAVCSRCGTVLFSHKKDSLDRSLALTFAALVLFIISNVYPVLEIKADGIYQATTLLGGVTTLYSQGLGEVAFLVLLTAILFPFLEIVFRLYVVLPLKLGKVPWKLTAVLKLTQKIKPWGMIEVFMLGILVSVIKLAKMVTVITGPSLYAFLALIFVMAGAAAVLDVHSIWEKAGEQ
jgi:paraquat-inducible protein A